MTRRKKEKYDLILEAALKVFAEYGFHGSQVSKIAKEADVADGTIYLYFKNKEDLLITLIREGLNALVGKINNDIKETDSADEILRKICKIHLADLEKNVNVAYVFQNELRQSSPELRTAISFAVKPYFQLFEQVLQKGIDEGTFRPNLDIKLIRRLLFGAMDEVVASWLSSGRKYSLSGQVDNIVEFFLRGLS